MPRPKTIGRTEAYINLRQKAATFNETKDCTVVAVAAACGVEYAVAHEAMARFGREEKKGARDFVTRAAIESFGFTIREFRYYGFGVRSTIQDEFISRYPAPHCNVLKSVTTHHPERFRDAWRDGKNYLLFSNGHVSAVVNGELHDWAVGRALRVYQIWEVTKV